MAWRMCAGTARRRPPLVCIDPKTGEIKAMVGGADYKKSQFNIAARGRRQPGSSFKAVVYSAAINDGSVKENTTVFDGPTNFGTKSNPYIPKDDGHYSYNHVTLREAMAQSINVPAVRVLQLITPQAAIRYARMMGIHSRLAPVPSLALGSSPVTPLEMASVYCTFPAGGNHPGAVCLDADDRCPRQCAGRRAADHRDACASEGDGRAARRHAARGRHRRHGGQGGGYAPRRARQDGHDAGPQRRLVRRLHARPGLRGLGRASHLQVEDLGPRLWRADGRERLGVHGLRPDLGAVHGPGIASL